MRVEGIMYFYYCKGSVLLGGIELGCEIFM